MTASTVTPAVRLFPSQRNPHTCKQCWHPHAWHGDRAVTACLGVAPSVWSPSKLSNCPCEGWVA